MSNILVVDDDKDIRRGLQHLLGEKYNLFESIGMDDTLAILKAQKIDLCLLDVNLANCNGFDLCRTIRMMYYMPIIFITVNDDEDSLARGLTCGGDDYVTKPFSFLELDLRIMAQLRRVQYQNKQNKSLLIRGAYILNTSNFSLSKDGANIEITRMEYRILKKLMENEGCLVTRDMLLYELWDANESYVDNNTLTVNISRIRKKLSHYSKINPIETVYGIGYRWKAC